MTLDRIVKTGMSLAAAMALIIFLLAFAGAVLPILLEQLGQIDDLQVKVTVLAAFAAIVVGGIMSVLDEVL